MRIYIDFDGTLFDTDQQAIDFKNVFLKYGVNNIDFNTVQKEIFDNKQLFDIEKILSYLVEKFNIENNIYKDIDIIFNRSYVYPEVESALEELIKEGYELCVFTYGNLKFQKRKIESSKITKYFKEIIITDKDKSKLELDYINSIFIDNNPKEVKKLYDCGATVIRIKRNSDKYSKIDTNISDIFECKDFNEIVHLIKGNVNKWKEKKF